jgi:hypothetical protein
MNAPRRSNRTLAAGLALALALPAMAQEYDAPPPPPPEELPWAPPAPPAPPEAPRRARPQQPVYRPDATYPPRHAERYRPPPAAYPEAPYPPPPPAARPWYPQVELAFRTGVASPGGDAADGLRMADLFGEQLSLGVELGVRTTPNLYVGLFAEGGVGQAGAVSGCLGTGRCDTSSASGRVGVGMRWHLAPYAPIDPWFGYGVAISGATVSGDDAFGSFSRTLTGVEFAKLSVGADLKLSRGAALGLYAEWTSGVFTEMEDRENGAVVSSGHIDGTATHSWFTVGPRIRF